MATSNFDTRVDALSKEIDTLLVDAKDENQRKALLGIIMCGMAKVELPVETIWRMIMSPHAPAALMVLIRMGVVKDLVAAQKPKTAREIADSVSGSEMLIVRMMRPLTALGVFRETDVQTYTSSPISELLTSPPLIGGYQFMFDLATRSLANMPRYLEKTGFKHVDNAPGPFQDCNNTEDGMFSYLMKNPDMMSNFNDFMAGSLETRPNWFDTFPADEIVLNGAKSDPESNLLVDVGGGEGHDLAAFGEAFPHAHGKIILQDLPPVIANIKEGTLSDCITCQPHDFFTQNPVKGARAYYFRNIFHDWPDHSCVEIMKQTAASMEKGYSKMIIFEWILPAKGVPLYPALLDVNMMALLNGRERTEEQWTTLLAEAGLKVLRFRKAGDDAEGLIEAELA
ncbi:S-adenosyl-L-methionine-dependent methyltransferase [Marasmius fiardii PR-910]|nr:S-adenosyl-L-methionine-dependent methyltransferase [Marasmius fiardii PR-910]